MLDTDLNRNIVREAYNNLFGRQPDPQGLELYSTYLKEGRINKDQLYHILQNSQEYKEKNLFLNVSNAEKFLGKITYIQTIYVNDFHNALHNVKMFNQLGDNIDCIVVFDDTISLENMKFIQNAGAFIKYSQWLDDCPRQRNVALQMARELQSEWVISSDPDEHYNDDFIAQIRYIIGSAKRDGYDLIKVNQVEYDEDTHIENKTDYFKDLVYQLRHGVAYQGYGNLPTWHEGIFGLNKSIRLPKNYYYRHEKSRMDALLHHVQGMYIVGGGPNLGAENPSWIELRKITDMLGITTWYGFDNYLKNGNIDINLKNWIINHRNDNTKDGDQNARAVFQYYFEFLHPDQNIDKLTSIDFRIK
jgi:hypothetical protein